MRILVLCMLFGIGASAAGQELGERAGTWEFGFNVFDTSSATLLGEGGSSIRVDGDLGYGAVGSYNFTSRFALSGELSWTTPSYAAVLTAEDTGLDATVDTELEASFLLIKAVYYFLERNLTPFVELGAGWADIDTNIVDGPPQTGCWWDPWWGYVCRQFYSTYAETRTAFTAAVGVRWDLSRSHGLRASWGTLQIDTSARTEDHKQDVLRFEYLWKF